MSETIEEITKERDAFKKAVTALWHALSFFTVEEFNYRPDRFHDLVETADKECAPYRLIPCAPYVGRAKDQQ